MQDKCFKRQPAAVTAGLIAAALLLVSVMAFSEIGLTRLEKEVMPKIDEAIAAAQRGDIKTANSLSAAVDERLRKAEPTLMLIAGHRDLMDMLRASGEAVQFGGGGSADDYIEALYAVRIALKLILENNDLTFGNIL